MEVGRCVLEVEAFLDAFILRCFMVLRSSTEGAEFDRIGLVRQLFGGTGANNKRAQLGEHGML